MKTTIIALSAAALVAAAPAALAQGVPGKTPGLQHNVSKKHHPGVSGYAQMRETQAKGSKTGYPGASSYAPDERSRFLESVRQGGGGGGGGGGSGM
jgi:opacity protein-like surface antigen